MVKDMIVENILDDILKEFDRYDGSMDSGIEVIQSNQISIEKLQTVVDDKNIILDKYRHKVALIMNKQNNLLKSLDKDKKALLRKLEQINKKNKVVNNYMTAITKPIFIDKDM